MDKAKNVLVTGNFNILHPGHLRLFKFAKELGDNLIVGVNGDKIGGAAIHVPELMRLDNVSSNILVDETILIDKPIKIILEEIKPDIVVKGKEYEGFFNEELEVVERYGGKLLFSSGEVVFSSLDLISNYIKEDNSLVLEIPHRFLQRHDFGKEDLKEIVEKFSSLKVCVVGDLIVDEYITCDPLGMSQEDPTIVVTPVDSKKFIGGAGIVAAHAAGLGADVSFFSIAGDDENLKFAKESLDSFKVKNYIFIDETRPTTLKQRFRSHEKTLLRVSHLHQTAISTEIQDKIYSVLEKEIKKSNLLVFSDFNYGCLPQALVDRIIELGKKHNVIMAADSQSSSQMGDISRFIDMDFLFPTEHEARLSLRNYDDGLVVLSEKLSHQANAKNIFLKLGPEGVLLHLKNSASEHSQTDRLKALNKFPKDVSGAGDSMMITSLLSHSTGANEWLSACLGSLAAGVQVGRVGNIPITKDEILKSL